MKIAIPIANGLLCPHFGHCEQFALVEVDQEHKVIVSRKDITPPPHQPGLLPPWLAEQGAKVVIAGGMGQRAVTLFAEKEITVIVGAASQTPEALVNDYLAGTLLTGSNACDH
jgi:predicted Fe-Mo cluster-binding NifX family protein